MGDDAAAEFSAPAGFQSAAAYNAERTELRRSSLSLSPAADPVHFWRSSIGREAGGSRVFKPRNGFAIRAAGCISSAVSLVVARAAGRKLRTVLIPNVDD